MKTDKEIMGFVEDMSSAHPLDQKVFLEALEKYFDIPYGESLQELKDDLIECQNSIEQYQESEVNCRDLIYQHIALIEQWNLSNGLTNKKRKEFDMLLENSMVEL